MKTIGVLKTRVGDMEKVKRKCKLFGKKQYAKYIEEDLMLWGRMLSSNLILVS